MASDSQTTDSQTTDSQTTDSLTTGSQNPISPPTPRSHFIWFFTLAILGCAADLVSKASVFNWLGEPSGIENIHWVIQDYVGIETALNHGAVFGLGQGKVWFFAGMSFVALAGILIWLFRYSVASDWLMTLTLGVITGGILGNLYDRLGIWSNFQVFAVRDWIRLSYQHNQYVWPNFNIADSLLVVGAVLLVWHSFRNPHPS